MTQVTSKPTAAGARGSTAAPGRWKKWAAVSVLFVVAGGSIFWGIRTAFPPPPAIPSDLDGVTSVLQSKAFAEMSDRQRQPYYDKMRELTRGANPKELGERFRKLPKEIRDDPTFRANTRDAMADQMLTMVAMWASTPSPLRNMVLDKLIDGQQSWKPRAGATSQRTPEQEAEAKARREREREEGMKWIERMVERGNPQKQAYVSEFMKAMRARRIERGLPADPPNRGGPPR